MAIRVSGLQDVENMFESYLDNEQIKASLERACAIVERSAKENAPKGNGELRRSITSRIDETESGDLEGVVYTPLEYAPYVEFGTGLFAVEEGRSDVPWCYFDEKKQQWFTTSGQHPQPYLIPALQDNRDRIIDELREGFRK